MACPTIIIIGALSLLLLLAAQDPERLRYCPFADSRWRARLRALNERWRWRSRVRRRRRRSALILPAGRRGERRLGRRRSPRRAIREGGDSIPAEMVVQRWSPPSPRQPRHPPLLELRELMSHDPPQPPIPAAALEQFIDRSPAEPLDGYCTCNPVEAEQRYRCNNKAHELVVGCFKRVFPEPRNTMQEQGDPNPAFLVK